MVGAWRSVHLHHGRPAGREREPWYPTKTEPSFEDMITKLRRVIIAAKFLPTRRPRPTHEEIQAVQQAWEAAAA